MDVKHHKSGHITRPTVDIPPRKLLSSINSPSSASSPLPKDYSYNSDSEDPYARDHFRMYEFKIRQCTRSRSHDWTDCPFSHPGEKARRRDPLRFQYTGEVCPQFSRHGGYCSRGDECGFAHGVFECWLHPSRYRTEACKDGKHCKRKVCFFAHSPRQLRVLPPSLGFGCETTSSMLSNKNNNRCCLFCSHSPTSTLSGLSRSPPAFSRLSHRRTAALNELISSFDSVSLTETLADSSSQFVLSPSSTPSYVRSQIQLPPASFFSDEFTPRGGRLSDFTAAASAAAEARDKNGFEVGSSGDLDLGWVNDLLT